MKKVGDQVHLTVGKVSYHREGRLRKGVASTMLADRLEPGATVRVFPQPNHGGFTVPEDSAKPMIMVGPGTGIAPFMAFLQERDATAAAGHNWLFFGDQREAFDYLYEDELKAYHHRGLLTRLDVAFSRDSEQKVYVQDRMREHAVELWKWLKAGAYFFVCGDAARMANDVDRTLKDIIAQQGSVCDVEANAYVKQMIAERRYVRDVY
jgi:sulfite reductase (NADPH) flavoprotein alpha-component